jgi:hypothetical protein
VAKVRNDNAVSCYVLNIPPRVRAQQLQGAALLTLDVSVKWDQ